MESDVVTNLHNVKDRLMIAHEKRQCSGSGREPRLVAVSKTKPLEMILECYSAGQRHFGENYAQELSEKSNNFEVREQCPEIRWHFIGPIQSNKVKMLVKSPNIFMIETVASLKIANMLEKTLAQESLEVLKIMVQVNTSGEEQKSGEDEEGALALCKHIRDHCPHLELCGLMTIGSFSHDLSIGPNPDFQKLIATRLQVASELGIDPSDLELSMGMSGDFEHAVEVGSTNVRVGSTIFGERMKKN